MPVTRTDKERVVLMLEALPSWRDYLDRSEYRQVQAALELLHDKLPEPNRGRGRRKEAGKIFAKDIIDQFADSGGMARQDALELVWARMPDRAAKTEASAVKWLTAEKKKARR